MLNECSWPKLFLQQLKKVMVTSHKKLSNGSFFVMIVFLIFLILHCFCEEQYRRLDVSVSASRMVISVSQNVENKNFLGLNSNAEDGAAIKITGGTCRIISSFFIFCETVFVSFFVLCYELKRR
jgi:hypothetical protein